MAHGYPDFEGDKSKVYSGADWSAIEAYDKNFRVLGGNITWGNSTTLDYAVPVGKILYITGLAYGSVASAAADYDHFLYVKGFIRNVTTATVLAEAGGVGGGGITFSKPLVIPGGETVRSTVSNYSNITCNIAVTAWGYEV